MTTRSIAVAIEILEFASRFPVLAVLGQAGHFIPFLVAHF